MKMAPASSSWLSTVSTASTTSPRGIEKEMGQLLKFPTKAPSDAAHAALQMQSAVLDLTRHKREMEAMLADIRRVKLKLLRVVANDKPDTKQ